MSARRFAALFGAAGFLVLSAAIAGNAQTRGPIAADNLPIPLYNKIADGAARPALSERADGRSASAATANTAKRSPETIAKYVGATVINAVGDKVGQIEDFVTETDGDGSMTYAVIGTGKQLALGAKKVAIPVAQLKLKGDRLKLAAGVSQEDLNSWPDYEPRLYRSVARGAAADSAAGVASGAARGARPTTVARD